MQWKTTLKANYCVACITFSSGFLDCGVTVRFRTPLKVFIKFDFDILKESFIFLVQVRWRNPLNISFLKLNFT